MLPYFTRAFGNPHSRQHARGWAAEDAVEAARRQVAALIGAPARDIIFTSGATEANNLAIKGAARRDPGRNEIVTCATEHKCVLEACRSLEREGFRLTVLPVTESGLIDLDQLAAALNARTALVSVMAVNNEIGVIQPIAEIARLVHQHGALFHTDAAQAAGKIALDVEAMNIDLMSISGHKLYAPMGIGALYVRRQPGPRLQPLFDGGGQERGLRSGTLPLPLCVGLGVACDIARDEMEEESERLVVLRDRLHEALRARLLDIHVNGDLAQRVAGNLNIAFPGVDAEDLMMEVKERGGVVGLGLHVGGDRAVLRASRARPSRRPGAGFACASASGVSRRKTRSSAPPRCWRTASSDCGRAGRYRGSQARARCVWIESACFPNILSEHDLFRKPVPTFRDHALTRQRLVAVLGRRVFLCHRLRQQFLLQRMQFVAHRFARGAFERAIALEDRAPVEASAGSRRRRRRLAGWSAPARGMPASALPPAARRGGRTCPFPCTRR